MKHTKARQYTSVHTHMRCRLCPPAVRLRGTYSCSYLSVCVRVRVHVVCARARVCVCARVLMLIQTQLATVTCYRHTTAATVTNIQARWTGIRALDITADEPSPSCACAPEPVAGRMMPSGRIMLITIMPSESSELRVPCSPCQYGTICSRSPSSCSSPVYVCVCARGRALQPEPCESPRMKKSL